MRRNVLLVLLFAAALAAIPMTAPRLPVVIEVYPDRLSLSAGGMTDVIATLPPKTSFTGVRIAVPRAIVPMTFQGLSVRFPGGEVRRLEIPHPKAPSSLAPATGDWWIDRKGSTTGPGRVLPEQLTPPFTLTFELTGRGNEFARLDLMGDRPFSFFFRNGLVNGDMAVRNGRELLFHDYFYLDAARSGRGIATTLLLLAAGASGLCLLIRLASREPSRMKGDGASPGRLSSFLKRRAAWIAAGVILASLCGELWVAGSVLEKTPHFQDDLGYLLRAKWLASGKLTQPVDELEPHLAIPFAVKTDGEWFIGYTIGWPALLAVGQALRAAWIVPPLCGALSLGILFLLGRRLYGPATGLFAMVFAALSPLGSILSASPLSHAGTSLLILSSVFLSVTPPRREGSRRVGMPGPRLAGSGLLLGLAFCCRPLTAAAMGLPVCVFLVLSAPRSREARSLGRLGAFAGSLVIGTIPVFVDNALTTGKPWVFGLELLGQGQRLANWIYGLHWMDVSLAQLPPMLFGWLWLPRVPPLLTFAVAGAFLLPFLLRRASPLEWLFLSIFACLVAAHLFHKSPGNHGYGPRYYAEALPFLHLLAAAGLTGTRTEKETDRDMTAPIGAVIALLLAATSLIAWPRRMELHRGYNDIDSSLVTAVGNAKIEEGVIVLDPQNYLQWVRASRLVPVTWNDRLVVVGRSAENSALYERYPERSFYLWRGQSLVSLGKPGTDDIIEAYPPASQEVVETLAPLLGDP